jgi:FkbM family methyltransferase
MATKLRQRGNQIIKSLVKDKHFDVVVNLGCGNDTDKEGGYYSDYFDADKVIKIDPNPTLKGLDYIAGSEDMPLKNKSADLVFLNWVFIPDDPSVDISIQTSIIEIARVLKTGGRALISLADASEGHMTSFGKVKGMLSPYFDLEDEVFYHTENDVYLREPIDWHATYLMLVKKEGRKIFIDGGAHDGCSARKYRAVYDPDCECEILSFEPGIETQKCDPNHLIIRAALWNEDGHIDFFEDTKRKYGSSVMKDKRTGKLDKENPHRVISINLSKWITDHYSVLDSLELKLDVEGAEYIILDQMLKDGSMKLVDSLHIEWHHHKVGVSKSEHDRIVLAIEVLHIPIEEWDAIGY